MPSSTDVVFSLALTLCLAAVVSGSASAATEASMPRDKSTEQTPVARLVASASAFALWFPQRTISLLRQHSLGMQNRGDRLSPWEMVELATLVGAVPAAWLLVHVFRRNHRIGAEGEEDSSGSSELYFFSSRLDHSPMSLLQMLSQKTLLYSRSILLSKHTLHPTSHTRA
jgi:hypothetical protein